MRLDAHQHFWCYDAQQYPWIPPDSPLHRDWLPPDLEKLQKPLGLEGSIAVQARQVVAESDWLLALAAKHSVIKGVVGWVDLRSPEVERDLARLSKNPKFVGVRHVVQDEPDPRFMLGEAFLRGLSLLKSYQLTYDFLIFPHQLPATLEVAQKFPEQKFVLDHLAKPSIKSGEIEPWKQSLQRLAKLPNVSCKVSGMLTEANHQHWKPDDFRPYFDVVFEAFTPARLMYGSDWPVCLFAGQYEQAFHLVEAYARHLSSTDQQGLWGENAARFYLQR